MKDDMYTTCLAAEFLNFHNVMCLDWAKQVLHLLEKTIHRLTTIVFLAAEFYK